MSTFFGLLLSLTALVLIVVVLIQRGRGGGLAGALGGAGGQSAFGTKAGDLFTKITISLAAFWILLCIVALRVLSSSSSRFSTSSGDEQRAPEKPGAGPTSPAAPSGAGNTNGATSPAAPTPAGSKSPAPTAPAGK